MNPQRLRKLVRRWGVAVLLFTLAGALIAFVVTKRLTPTYQSTATILVVAGPQQSQANTGVALNTDEVTATAASLMTERPLLQRAISELHLILTPDQLAAKVTAAPLTNAELVNLTVSDANPALATAIANTLASDFVDQVTQQNTQRINQAGAALEAQITSLTDQLKSEEDALARANARGQDTTAVSAEVTADTAQLATLTANYGTFKATQSQDLETVTLAAQAATPTTPSSPRMSIDLGIGVVAGLLLGLGVAALAEYLDRGLHSEEDVRERLGVPCLAIVPRFNARPGGRSSQSHRERAREAYRRLRTNLLFSELDAPLRSIVITSARPGEGKTRTASNLAVSLASSEKSVLLIDADMHRPNQHRIFSKPITQGLSEMLVAAAPGDSPNLNGRHDTNYANLSVLTSGVLPPNPSELLASRRTRLLLDALQQQRDIVIIDTPPAQALTDALSVAAHSSGVILVVESGKTNADQAAAVIDSLRNVGATVLGVVLNKAKDKELSAYYYYDQAVTQAEVGRASRRQASEALAQPAVAGPPPPPAARGDAARR